MHNFQTWEEIGFELETTSDGSYSLKILKSAIETNSEAASIEDDQTIKTEKIENSRSKDNENKRQFLNESMHHSGGALTESMYIYAPPAIISLAVYFYQKFNFQYQGEEKERKINDLVFFSSKVLNEVLEKSGAEEKDKLQMQKNLIDVFNKLKLTQLNQSIKNQHLIVGLGLGYIEFLVTSFYLFFLREFKLNDPQDDGLNISIESYEFVPELRLSFNKYLNNEPHFSNEVYDQILGGILKFLNLSFDNKKQVILILKKSLVFKEALENKNVLDVIEYSALYFDAFSKKTSPELWDENLLRSLFSKKKIAACFSTYACTGLLKRTLNQMSFIVFKRKGFKGKRDSTFAIFGP